MPDGIRIGEIRIKDWKNDSPLNLSDEMLFMATLCSDLAKEDYIAYENVIEFLYFLPDISTDGTLSSLEGRLDGILNSKSTESNYIASEESKDNLLLNPFYIQLKQFAKDKRLVDGTGIKLNQIVCDYLSYVPNEYLQSIGVFCLISYIQLESSDIDHDEFISEPYVDKAFETNDSDHINELALVFREHPEAVLRRFHFHVDKKVSPLKTIILFNASNINYNFWFEFHHEGDSINENARSFRKNITVIPSINPIISFRKKDFTKNWSKVKIKAGPLKDDKVGDQEYEVRYLNDIKVIKCRQCQSLFNADSQCLCQMK